MLRKKEDRKGWKPEVKKAKPKAEPKMIEKVENAEVVEETPVEEKKVVPKRKPKKVEVVEV